MIYLFWQQKSWISTIYNKIVKITLVIVVFSFIIALIFSPKTNNGSSGSCGKILIVFTPIKT